MRNWSRRQRILGVLGLLALLVVLGMVAVSRWPAVGATVARPLRQVLGNRGVALLETALFEVQDGVQQARYDLGLQEAEAPWQTAALPTATAVVPPTLAPTSTPPPPTATRPSLAKDLTPPPTSIPTETPEPSPTAVPTPIPWTLPPLAHFGDLAGEGEWQPYLYNPAGEVVGLRTFLQPDAERPYAIVGVVAFDLRRAALHYVLGTQEPALDDGPRGSGVIPAEQLQSGNLLAAFNGGFMASHGAYGAMSGSVEALPAKEGYATVAIAPDGGVRIGVWGQDIAPDAEWAAWRQNARLVVEDGEINPRVYNGSITTWGGNINGNIVTWRSGLGISPDNQVLYFFAGPSMSMPTLAAAMTAVGVADGLLLDINESWVHFTAVRTGADHTLVAEPLFPEGMETWTDRYLRQSDRDFFYITAEDPEK
ncbi:MAG: hypothetical protein H6659_12205 [Ardenticatenaceae bacterium]|nr:hypothetical protein [Ardenticatenaceae bacterium]